MRTLLLAVLTRALPFAVLCAAGHALAGPNTNGALILHANTQLVVSSDPTNYCGQAALDACDVAVTSIPGGDEAHQTAWFAIAAFNLLESPRLSGVTFGVSYDDDVVLSHYGGCGDLDLPTANWPDSGEGTAITWNIAQTGHLTDVYYFVGYGYGADPSFFSLTPHPVGGSVFADDAVPSNLDPIQGFGTLGFNAPGPIAPCQGHAPINGACCRPDFGDCVVVEEQECALQGGVYQGDGTDCDPVPCIPTPMQRSTWGRIKQAYR